MDPTVPGTPWKEVIASTQHVEPCTRITRAAEVCDCRAATNVFLDSRQGGKMSRISAAAIATLCIALILGAALPSYCGDQYTLIFINNSKNLADVCIYQDDPDMKVQDVMSLAWITKRVAPTTTVEFTWEIDYCFVWSEQAELEPGLRFVASQTWEDASLSDNNTVTFRMTEGAYTFSDLTWSGYEGNLYIIGDRSLPIREAFVGIGVAGAAVYVAPAQPRWDWIYTPKPLYYITFGTFEPGEVLDVESISHKAPFQYQGPCHSLTAVLEEDNTWDIFETPQADE
jgi:hypothetical protein